jgi:hypothetical protein
MSRNHHRINELQGGWHLTGHLAGPLAVVLLLGALSTACSGHPPLASAAPSAPPREGCPRTLVLLVDAVPFEVARQATAGADGLFRELHGPWPVISTFPSSTSIAMGSLFGTLGLEPSPGYEARFYDAESAQVRGGGLFSYHAIPFPWRDGFFHWKTLGTWKKAIGYSHPLKFGRQEVHGAIEAFLASDEPLFLAYMTSTDAAAHLAGPEGLAEVLAAIDGALAEARQASGEPFRVVLLSDHGVAGGEPLVNTIGPLKDSLRKAGFAPGEAVRDPEEVAVVALGLLSSVALGTHPGEEIAVARAAVQTPGIELCAAQLPADPDRWWVQGAEGGAWIEHHGDGWRYRPEDGDPLGYAPVVESLLEDHGGLPGSSDGSNGRGSSDGSDGLREAVFPDDAWLAATVDHRFPDALARIRGAFSLVTHPASVVCSTAPGYMFGPARTAFTSRLTKGPLRWTHGALGRGASLGFLLTDIEGYTAAPALRATEALAPLVPLLAADAPCPLAPPPPSPER